MRLLSFLIMLALCVNSVTLAKGRIAKLTINGVGLRKSIDVTDHRILDISNWGGPPVDGIGEQPEQSRQWYEVAFYFDGDDGDLTKNYVAYYYPPSSIHRGIIYRPGQGVVWAVNVGAVYHPGEEGKWMYASRQWDEAWVAAVHPLIAGLASAPARPRSPAAISSWTKPKPGWLYVLDPVSKANRAGSVIWLVDPEAGNVMGSIRAGYRPDFALSPDGSRLYIASGEYESGELAVVDTATGNVGHAPLTDRVLYKPHYEQLPPYAGLAVAPDGVTVWIPGQHVVTPEKVETQLVAFDTSTGSFVTSRILLGSCGYGDFIPSLDPNYFAFLCNAFFSRPNPLHFIRVNAAHEEAADTVSRSQWDIRCGVANSFFSEDGRKLHVIRRDGADLELDIATGSLARADAPKQCNSIAHAGWPQSKDGARVYLGYGGGAPDGMSAARELRVFDRNSWKEVGRVITTAPFWSASASPDGRYVYAVSPANQAILVIDTATLEEKRTIRVGNIPATVLVAP